MPNFCLFVDWCIVLVNCSHPRCVFISFWLHLWCYPKSHDGMWWFHVKLRINLILVLWLGWHESAEVLQTLSLVSEVVWSLIVKACIIGWRIVVFELLHFSTHGKGLVLLIHDWGAVVSAQKPSFVSLVVPFVYEFTLGYWVDVAVTVDY